MEGTSGAVLLGSFREQPGRAALKAVGFVPEPRRADPEKHLGDQKRATLPSGNSSSAWSFGAIIFQMHRCLNVTVGCPSYEPGWGKSVSACGSRAGIALVALSSARSLT